MLDACRWNRLLGSTPSLYSRLVTHILQVMRNANLRRRSVLTHISRRTLSTFFVIPLRITMYSIAFPGYISYPSGIHRCIERNIQTGRPKGPVAWLAASSKQRHVPQYSKQGGERRYSIHKPSGLADLDMFPFLPFCYHKSQTSAT